MIQEYTYDYLTSIILSHGKGSHVWDTEGKKYIDYTNGWGAIILGYSNKELDKILTEHLKKGILFALQNVLVPKLKSKLLELFPSLQEMIFLKTGSEATSAAIRIARAFKKKEKIIRCGYHGWNDWCNFGRGTTHRDDRPDWGYKVSLPGIPKARRELTIELLNPQYFDMLYKIVKKNKGEIAALIIDPTEVFGKVKENLIEIQNIARDNDLLFILDEIKTGFRLSLGGAQEYYGLTPDITILSKAISNGLPLSVVLGKKDIMEIEYAYAGGTYSEETLSIASALGTIEILEKNNGISLIWKSGRRLISKLNDKIKSLDMENFVEIQGWNEPPMPYVRFNKENIRKKSLEKVRSFFYNELSRNGILMYHNQMNFITTSHSEKDIDETVEKCYFGFKKIKKLL